MIRARPVCVLVSFVVVCVGSFFDSTLAVSSASQSTAKIKGVVVDVNDAVVINATIRVVGGEIKRGVESGKEGEFEVEVPAGSYQITCEAKGFRRFAFSPLKLKTGETRVFDIRLKVAEPPGLVPAIYGVGSP